MLSVRNVTKIYETEKSKHKVVALNGVSIDFPETGFVFLLGKSGSGKSTLLNVIGGLDSFDSGEIIIKGKSSKNFSQSDFDSYRNTFIGFIFQEYNILENFTVAKNLALAIELQGKKVSKQLVEELLAQVEMTEYATRKPNQLSGGQKQRVAIARALIKNPEIIMADEPTGALDSNTGKQVMDTLKELSKTKLVIVVSHDRDFAEIYGDRIIELKDGNIISDVTKKEIESTETSSGVKVIDDNILFIKKGQQITPEQLQQISNFVVEKSKQSDTFISFDTDANEKLKESAKITDEGNREKFVETEQEDIKIKNYDPNSLKLIRSRLKFTDSFKIGASSLKHKVGRLIFTILLSFFAFTIFGIVDALSCWNRAASVYQAVELKNQTYVALQKRKKNKDDFSEESFKQSDIDALKAKFPEHSFKAVTDGHYMDNLRYDNQYFYTNSSYNNPYYETKINGYTTITTAEIQQFGFTLEGRLPETNDEVAISKHIFDILKELTADTQTPVTDYTKLSFDMKNSGNHVKVVGVVDDKTDLSTLKSLNGNGSSDYMMLMMLRNQIEYGFSNIAYVCESKFAELASLGVNAYYQLRFENNGFGINRDEFNSFSSQVEKYTYESSNITYKNSQNNTTLNLNKQNYTNTEFYSWEIFDEFNSIIYTYVYSDNKVYDQVNGKYLNQTEMAEFFTANGGDSNGDMIPDNFVNNMLELFVNSNITYYKNGSLTNNGQLVELGATDIFVPQYWLSDYMGPNWKESIDEGLTVTLCGEHSDDEIMKFNIVGTISGYGLLVSDETFESHIEPLYEGFKYAISTLTGTSSDADFIKYCETYNSDNVKYVVQNSATRILDSLEEAISFTAKIFFYIAIGFAVFASFLLMNFISLSISHKKREIGVLRALGARGSDIFGIFLNESTIISLINFTLAGLATYFGCYFINMSLLAKLGIDIVLLTPGIRQFALILAISWGSAFIASLLPTMKISRKKPIDAINNR